MCDEQGDSWPTTCRKNRKGDVNDGLKHDPASPRAPGVTTDLKETVKVGKNELNFDLKR
jgi:hypothetical protein